MSGYKITIWVTLIITLCVRPKYQDGWLSFSRKTTSMRKQPCSLALFNRDTINPDIWGYVTLLFLLSWRIKVFPKCLTSCFFKSGHLWNVKWILVGFAFFLFLPLYRFWLLRLTMWASSLVLILIWLYAVSLLWSQISFYCFTSSFMSQMEAPTLTLSPKSMSIPLIFFPFFFSKYSWYIFFFFLLWLKTVDSSKAGTQEAAAKPEPPPPAQEEKKSASKSPFLSFFKPQVRTYSHKHL